MQEQYIFVHDAILDAIQSGTTEVAASNLANHFKKLTEFNKGHGDELLEDDFKVSLVFSVEAQFPSKNEDYDRLLQITLL